MKKIFSLIAVVAVMLVGLAGNVMAYFESGELVRVVYQDNGTTEVATDLGSWSSLASSNNATVGEAFSLSQFSAAGYNNLNVAYFVLPTTSSETYYLSGETALAPTNNARANGTYFNAAGPVKSYYAAFGTSTAVADTTAIASYYSKMDKGGATVGKFAGFYNATGFGEANLADLANGGYVEQTIYAFANSASAGTGVAVAVIRTMADGTTLINPASSSTVPVPASFLLLGSGLLGLFGIRRKNS